MSTVAALLGNHLTVADVCPAVWTGTQEAADEVHLLRRGVSARVWPGFGAGMPRIVAVGAARYLRHTTSGIAPTKAAAPVTPAIQAPAAGGTGAVTSRRTTQVVSLRLEMR
jgi:hypothetical protein